MAIASAFEAKVAFILVWLIPRRVIAVGGGRQVLVKSPRSKVLYNSRDFKWDAYFAFSQHLKMKLPLFEKFGLSELLQCSFSPLSTALAGLKPPNNPSDVTINLQPLCHQCVKCKNQFNYGLPKMSVTFCIFTALEKSNYIFNIFSEQLHSGSYTSLTEDCLKCNKAKLNRQEKWKNPSKRIGFRTISSFRNYLRGSESSREKSP